MKKRLITILMISILLFTFTTNVAADATENEGTVIFAFGDANGDDKVNNVDALMILQYVFDNSNVITNEIDVDRNKKFDDADIVLILDVNHDKCVDNADIKAVMDHIFNENKYPTDYALEMPEVSPTCQAQGLTSYIKCASCGKNITEPKDIGCVPHEYVNGKCKYCNTDKPIILPEQDI